MFKIARLGFKRNIISTSFPSLMPVGGGGVEVREGPKMCHVLFEWPLNII